MLKENNKLEKENKYYLSTNTREQTSKEELNKSQFYYGFFIEFDREMEPRRDRKHQQLLEGTW